MAASYPTTAKTFSTKATNDIIEASHMNDVQDEVAAIESGLLTAFAHDLKFTDALYDIGKTGATRPRDLFLSRDAVFGGKATIGGVVTAAAQPRCRAYHNTTQSISDATLTAAAFNAESTDVGAMHDPAVNNTRITIPAGGDGFYLIAAAIEFASNVTGYRGVYLRKNGTTTIANSFVPAVNGNTTCVPLSAMVPLVATDYVEVMAYQTSTGALNIGSSADDRHWFSAAKLW